MGPPPVRAQATLGSCGRGLGRLAVFERAPAGEGVVGFRAGFDMSGAERFLGRCGFAAQHLEGDALYVANSSVALSCDGPLGDVLPGPPDDTYGFSPGERLVVMARITRSRSAGDRDA
jgi:hypothetical protein